MAKQHRGEHGHHTPEHNGGHGSKKPKGGGKGNVHRGMHVMKGAGSDEHVHPDHKAANAAFGMHEGFDGGEHYQEGHDEESNEECD